MAAMELIKTEKIAGITTSQIAKKAGISVGSLYQYFHNKESIFYALWESKLDDMYSAMTEFEQEPYLSLPRAAFFEQLLLHLQQAETDIAVNSTAFHATVTVYPELESLNHNHGERMAQKLAEYMQHFGSTWPQDKLKSMGQFLYRINASVFLFGEQVGFDYAETQHWGFATLRAMLDQCFDPYPNTTPGQSAK